MKYSVQANGATSLNPGIPMPKAAQEAHGISDAFLADKPEFITVASELLDFVGGAEVVLHNAPFHLLFLDAELQRIGLPLFSTHCDQIVDLLKRTKQFRPGKQNGIHQLCVEYGIDDSMRQKGGALIDAELLAEIYLLLRLASPDEAVVAG